MTLLNAPEYDGRYDKLKRNLLIGIPVTVLLLAIIGLAGAIMGHGYFFINLPVEHRVSVFLADCQAGQYEKAYGMWFNDPDWQQHPQKHDYSFARFKEDWTTESDWKGPVKTFHVDISKRDDTGTVVASTINGSPKPLFLKYDKADHTLSYTPMILKY